MFSCGFTCFKCCRKPKIKPEYEHSEARLDPPNLHVDVKVVEVAHARFVSTEIVSIATILKTLPPRNAIRAN